MAIGDRRFDTEAKNADVCTWTFDFDLDLEIRCSSSSSSFSTCLFGIKRSHRAYLFLSAQRGPALGKMEMKDEGWVV